MSTPEIIRIIRPDDFHLHLRDGDILRAVLSSTAEIFGRAIVMPNLRSPIRTVTEAVSYKQHILDVLPTGHPFKPLMTLYLTETTSINEIRLAAEHPDVFAVKLYPAGATTNSDDGVSDVEKIYPALEVMQDVGLPLLVHGEVVDPDVDIFDREQVFIDIVLEPICEKFTELKIVLEHITTSYAVDYIQSANECMAATITPHHMVINRNDLFKGGMRPHMYCLPVAKREENRVALCRAAVSGSSRFFLGTDSAPHLKNDKESDCGCAGIFNAPTTMQTLAGVFSHYKSIDNLQAFTSLNGAKFYGLAPNEDTITLKLADNVASVENFVRVEENGMIDIFSPVESANWFISDGIQLIGE